MCWRLDAPPSSHTAHSPRALAMTRTTLSTGSRPAGTTPSFNPSPPLVDIYAGSKEAIESSDCIRIKNRRVFDLLTQANAARNLIRQDFRKRMVAGSDVQHIIPTGGKNWVIYI